MEIHREKIIGNHASVFVISDIHEGNTGHNEEALKACIDRIVDTAKEKEVRVLLNGDLIDCIEVSDKRFDPVSISYRYRLRDLKDLPRKQADYVVEKLAPIKAHICAATIGNHEESYVKEHHFDVYDYYCKELECEKLGYQGVVQFDLRKPDDPGGVEQAD